MINQLQTIKTFVDREFGTVPHSLVVEDDMANGDRAVAILAVGDKRYRIEVTSAYIQPPLGQILMRDMMNGTMIERQKGDDAWHEIAAHIRGSSPNVVAMPKSEVAPLAEPEQMTDGRAPFLAMSAKFITERGEAVGGMEELAAMVTRVLSPTAVSLTVFPDTGEPFWRNNVQRRSATRRHNCWDFADEAPVTERTLSAALDDLTKPKRSKTA